MSVTVKISGLEKEEVDGQSDFSTLQMGYRAGWTASKALQRRAGKQPSSNDGLLNVQATQNSD